MAIVPVEDRVGDLAGEASAQAVALDVARGQLDRLTGAPIAIDIERDLRAQRFGDVSALGDDAGDTHLQRRM